jgi:hypothetical protein
MNALNIANLLLQQLTNGNFETCIKLFSENAIVIAPAGQLTAEIFLKNFYADNIKANITLFNTFSSSNQNTCAIYLQLEEHKVNGIIITFTCATILENNNDKIEKLTIIFDTYPIRSKFPELF